MMISKYPWLNTVWKNIQSGSLTTFQPLLIAGAPGRGQWALAQQTAKAFLCEQPTKPCGFCPSCLAFDAKSHPDLWLLQDEGESISIDTTRLLHEHTHQKPMRANGCRMVLIEHFDRATVAAQQALLKIFEEPFVKTAIVLTSRYVERVIPTIRSRMAVVNISPVSRVLFQQWCEGQEIPYQDKWYDLTDGSPLLLKTLDVEKLEKLMSAVRDQKVNEVVSLAENLDRPVFFAGVYHVLAERARASLRQEDFDRLDAWQTLYQEAGMSKSTNWNLQCRSFFIS
jgi:DNA polymerase III delta prime subunit